MERRKRNYEENKSERDNSSYRKGRSQYSNEGSKREDSYSKRPRIKREENDRDYRRDYNENRRRNYNDRDNENRGRRYNDHNEERPNRSYGNRDRREDYERGDRNNPRRNFENGRDNQRRSYDSDRQGGDRDRRGFGGDDRRGQRRSYEGEKRSYNGENRREKWGRENKDSYKRRDDRGGYDRANSRRRRDGEYFEINGKRNTYDNAQTDKDGLIRLNKYISNSGICSRREADELIKAGAVSVNGEVITEMGHKVKPDDIIVYGGERLVNERKKYLLLNKPKGYITTMDDPRDRKTVLSLISKACKERLYPVGRLDRNTTGLLLFTNDGELTKKLTHPSFGAKKIYHVELDKPLKSSDMQKILEGIELEDGMILADDIQYAENGDDKKVVGIELHSGRNRIVRRIFETLGYEVFKLDRIYFAGLTKKNLPRGQFRFLSDKEVAFLKMLKTN